LRELLDAVVNCFTRQTVPTVNRKHVFIMSKFANKRTTNAQQNSVLL
jgi:hypothetical protein